MAGSQVRNSVVLVDTSTIWTADDDLKRLDIVPLAFRQLWDQLAKAEDVTLMIPQVVIGELAYQRQRHLARAFKEARTNLAQIRATLGVDVTTKIATPTATGYWTLVQLGPGVLAHAALAQESPAVISESKLFGICETKANRCLRMTAASCMRSFEKVR